MKRRASSSRKPSSDGSSNSSAVMWMKFFIESVATTSVLSPSVYEGSKASPRAVIPTSAAKSELTPSVR